MRRVCFYHAGCPDGFGAAWALWRAWGAEAEYLPRGHDDALHARSLAGAQVVFADIAPDNAALRALGEHAAELVVLDHHASSAERYAAEPMLARALAARGHTVRFDLSHSGAVLAWQHFHPGKPVPELLRYVEDQDLWSWKLPRSEEVNAAIGSYPRSIDAWCELAARAADALAAEGAPILRANQIEVERALQAVHPVWIGGLRVEAVNARHPRSAIGHVLATRAAFGAPCGAVYRLIGDRVDVSLYSTGAFDVARIATGLGGGGHRNAAGFSVSLAEWLESFVAAAPSARPARAR
jgi:oligoribonuclease NrnB/cAMP/cGMP phosphodiesterase (DHH superfamily)